MSQTEQQLQVCQIQIQPVDNGFVIQAINLDVAGRKSRLIAQDIKSLRYQLGKLVETLFDPVPEKAPPTAKPKATPTGGPAGTKTSS